MGPDIEEDETLSIGAIIGGVSADLNAWGHEIGVLEREIDNRQRGMSSPLRLNVIYHLSGSVMQTDFTGIEIVRFSRKRSLLRVDAAVPSGPVENRRALLLDLLRAAIDQAEVFARSRRIADDLDGIRKIVPNH